MFSPSPNPLWVALETLVTRGPEAAERLEKGQGLDPHPYGPGSPSSPHGLMLLLISYSVSQQERRLLVAVQVSTCVCWFKTEGGGDRGASTGSEFRKGRALVCGRQGAGLIDKVCEQPRHTVLRVN